MKKALILDFDGVVSRTLFETHADTERVLGLAPGTLGWRGPFDPVGDVLWRALRAGAISESDYWLARTREVGRLVGENWDRVETLVQRARGDDPDAHTRPETRALMHDARAAGIRVAMLSNDLDLLHGPETRARVAALREADAIVDGARTGILMPDPRAYRLCLDELGVAPEEAVFVDCQARHVDGARAAGLISIEFDVTRPAASCDATRALLGLRLRG